MKNLENNFLSFWPLLPSIYMIFKVQGNVTRGRFSLLPSFYMIHKVQEKVIRGRFSLLPSFYMIWKIIFEVQNLPSFCNFLTYSCVFNVSQECHYCHLDLVVIEITGQSPISRKDSKVRGFSRGLLSLFYYKDWGQ